jgi:hypothetical protein
MIFNFCKVTVLVAGRWDWEGLCCPNWETCSLSIMIPIESRYFERELRNGVKLFDRTSPITRGSVTATASVWELIQRVPPRPEACKGRPGTLRVRKALWSINPPR